MNIQVDTVKYLGLAAPPERIGRILDIAVSGHAYLPKTDDLAGDWVAHIATPAFKLVRAQRGAPVPSFCSIGTGSGLDVLAAIETLGSIRAGFTDLDAGVVATAARNVARNLIDPESVRLEYGAGDLLSPLRKISPRYDIIYENLPNVPAADGVDVAKERNSGHYLERRREEIPETVRLQMLDLHYLALLRAKEFLAAGGAVLSTLGARVELDVFRKLGALAGYDSQIFTYGWKIQAEAEEVIAGYARHQAEGFGPFHFYYADDLRAVFSGIPAEESGGRAAEIERILAPHRLDAAAAWRAWRGGAVVGHTVAVLKSVPEEAPRTGGRP